MCAMTKRKTAKKKRKRKEKVEKEKEKRKKRRGEEEGEGERREEREREEEKGRRRKKKEGERGEREGKEEERKSERASRKRKDSKKEGKRRSAARNRERKARHAVARRPGGSIAAKHQRDPEQPHDRDIALAGLDLRHEALGKTGQAGELPARHAAARAHLAHADPELTEKRAFVRQTAVRVAQDRPDRTVQTHFGIGQASATGHAQSFRPR